MVPFEHTRNNFFSKFSYSSSYLHLTHSIKGPSQIIPSIICHKREFFREEMVKVTVVGRVSDGLPLAQGLRYMNEEYGYLSCYRQQAEFILQEISRGALTASKMNIIVDHFCFKYPSSSFFSVLLISFKVSFGSYIDQVVFMLPIFCYASYSSFTCTLYHRLIVQEIEFMLTP